MNGAFKQEALSKVPEVTLVFWIIKIAATTLGETGGDTVTMTLNWGYRTGTALCLGLLIVLAVAQIVAKRFYVFLYWATIVGSTTFGTTMADFADRSLGIGYTGGSSLLFVCLMAVLGLWYWSEGTVSVNTVSTPKVEAFYWAAITFSQTLGTALGDWAADTGGLGYEGGALVFATGLAVIVRLRCKRQRGCYTCNASDLAPAVVGFGFPLPDPVRRHHGILSLVRVDVGRQHGPRLRQELGRVLPALVGRHFTDTNFERGLLLA
jgi:uncharacterized membrane-anchored protein